MKINYFQIILKHNNNNDNNKKGNKHNISHILLFYILFTIHKYDNYIYLKYKNKFLII